MVGAKNEYVFIEGFQAEGVWEYLYLITFIVKFQQQKGNKVIVILSSRFNSSSQSVKNHLNMIDPEIKTIFLKDYFYNPINIFRSIIESLKLIVKWSHLINYNVKNIMIGDLIYDTILINLKNIYTIKKLRMIYLRYIFVSMLEFFSYNTIIGNNKPSKLFISHLVYSRFGILGRLVNCYTSEIYLTKPDKTHLQSVNTSQLYETQINNPYKLFQRISDKSYSFVASSYFNKRIAGEDNQIDAQNSFSNKIIMNRKQLNNELHIVEKNRFTVLVASHVLSDAPHNSLLVSFKDYYEWLIYTLFELRKNNLINVIVKEHPSAELYGEKDVIKNIVETNFRDSNIYFLPNKINTKSLLDFVDTTITISGTIGIEFACNGIPSIILGSPYYKGNGFTIEPISKSDYNNILKKITTIPKLNSMQSMFAKILFYEKSYSEIFYPGIFETIQSSITKKGLDHRNQVDYIEIIEIINSYFKSFEFTKIDLDQYINRFSKGDLDD